MGLTSMEWFWILGESALKSTLKSHATLKALLAWARPGWGMTWDGKVSFRSHEALLFPTLADLANLADLGKTFPESVLRPWLPHAPGVRMTVVAHELLQMTPASWDLVFKFLDCKQVKLTVL